MNDHDIHDLLNRHAVLPKHLSIPFTEVHVWKVKLDLSPTQRLAVEEALTDDERERAGRIKMRGARQSWIATRAALRLILGRYVDVQPRELVFDTEPFGKPYLSRPATDPPLTFNVAHSGSFALCAIGVSRRIGVDIELIRPRIDYKTLMKRICSHEERRWMETIPERDRLVAFFTYWTCKEAYVKAIGQGLRFPFSAISVTFRANGSPTFARIDGDAEQASQWSLYAWSPVSSYLAALVAEGEDWQSRCWDWNWEAWFAQRLRERA